MWLCRSDQSQVVGLENPAHRGHRRAAGQRQAELLVLVRGGDELVGVRLDADGDAHEHVLDDAGVARDPIQPLDLGHRVQHHVPDTVLDRRRELLDGLVVAVQGDSLRREARVQRDGEFSAAADVQRQALFVDPARDLGAQERLGRVVNVLATAEGIRDVAAACPEVVLIDDEHRGAELGGDFGHRHPGNRDDTVRTANSVVRPDIRSQLEHLGGVKGPVGSPAVVGLLGVPGTGRVRDHIRSGALTPRMLSPLAMT